VALPLQLAPLTRAPPARAEVPGIKNPRRAIVMLADQAREVGDDRRANYLQAFRMGLTGRIK